MNIPYISTSVFNHIGLTENKQHFVHGKEKCFQGNSDDTEELVRKFKEKYADHIYSHSEVGMPPISTQEVWEAFMGTKCSAAAGVKDELLVRIKQM